MIFVAPDIAAVSLQCPVQVAAELWVLSRCEVLSLGNTIILFPSTPAPASRYTTESPRLLPTLTINIFDSSEPL